MLRLLIFVLRPDVGIGVVWFRVDVDKIWHAYYPGLLIAQRFIGTARVATDLATGTTWDWDVWNGNISLFAFYDIFIVWLIVFVVL